MLVTVRAYLTEFDQNETKKYALRVLHWVLLQNVYVYNKIKHST